MSIKLDSNTVYTFTNENQQAEIDNYKIIFNKIIDFTSDNPKLNLTIHSDSDPFEMTMIVDDKKELDLNNDGSNDIGFMVNSISSNSATIEVWKNAPEDRATQTQAPLKNSSAAQDEQSENSWPWFYEVAGWSIAGLIAIIIKLLHGKLKNS